MRKQQEEFFKSQVQCIVSWQFSGVTNLTKEAYNDSLRIIAEKVLEEVNKLEFSPINSRKV